MIGSSICYLEPRDLWIGMRLWNEDKSTKGFVTNINRHDDGSVNLTIVWDDGHVMSLPHRSARMVKVVR
jgi:hypothetical protein